MVSHVSSRDQDKPIEGEFFDIRFTPASLEKRLQVHAALFRGDGNGGLVCRQCGLPAMYGTLCLKISVGRRNVDKETTRSLPLCVMCQGWDHQVAYLCLTTEEAIARKALVSRTDSRKSSVAKVPAGRQPSMFILGKETAKLGRRGATVKESQAK